MKRMKPHVDDVAQALSLPQRGDSADETHARGGSPTYKGTPLRETRGTEPARELRRD